VSALPFIPANIGIRSGFLIRGRPAPPPSEQPITYVTVATPSYVDVLRIPLLSGRWFQESDGPASPPVAVINDFLRRRYWPNENPIGQRLAVRFLGKPIDLEIVGVVGDLRHDGFDRGVRPELFVPFAQQPFGSMTFVVRTKADAAALVPELRRQIWAIDPLQTFYQTSTLEALVDDSVAARRFSAGLIASFAFIALALAATGIYGLISMSTAQRTQEIGVRIALGADRGSILRLIVGEGVISVAVGFAIGALAALAVTRALTRLLFDVTPGDPETFAIASLLLALVGVGASYVPARRATRVDPISALRAD
jgi:predicted permease